MIRQSAASHASLDDGERAELWASLALRNLRGIGAVSAKKLADFFGSPYKAILTSEQWDDPSLELGISPAAVRAYARGEWRKNAGLQWRSIKNSESGVILYNDPLYPDLLKETADAPLLLFYLGDPALLSAISVAVVGARKCTDEGMSVAVNIVRGLTHAGITTVSGMARGIDRVVHLAGLEGAGKSIAVLGSGVDMPSPPSNLDLYDLMREKGLIISELIPGSTPLPRHFPVRNRIISGLSRGVLVVEAAMRSGTLITARHAVEQNREVFAVPGSAMAETSEGCRDLIRRGARAVFSAEDILLELKPILQAEVQEKQRAASEKSSLDYTVLKSHPRDELGSPGILPWNGGEAMPGRARRKKSISFGVNAPVKRRETPDTFRSGQNPDENAILKLLNERENCHIDIIADTLKLDVSKLSGMLAMLEVRGLVKRFPGMFYALR